MITRQEYNEQVRKAGRERMKYLRDKYYHSGFKIYDPYGGIRKRMTEEERAVIRKELKARSRRSGRRTLIVFSLAFLILGIIFYLVLLSLI